MLTYITKSKCSEQSINNRMAESISIRMSQKPFIMVNFYPAEYQISFFGKLV